MKRWLTDIGALRDQVNEAPRSPHIYAVNRELLARLLDACNAMEFALDAIEFKTQEPDTKKYVQAVLKEVRGE